MSQGHCLLNYYTLRIYNVLIDVAIPATTLLDITHSTFAVYIAQKYNFNLFYANVIVLKVISQECTYLLKDIFFIIIFLKFNVKMKILTSSEIV